MTRIGISLVGVYTVCQTLLYLGNAVAGAQQEETLSNAFRLVLHQALVNVPPPNPEHLVDHALRDSYVTWATQVEPKLDLYLKSHRLLYAELAKGEMRNLFLQTVWYESTRAGLEPALVLGVIEVESGFNKFAISSAGAVGYMQVMPFWMNKALEQKGEPDSQRIISKLNSSSKLLPLQTNIRFGCSILRHYLDLEENVLIKALGRYNGNTLDASYARAVMSSQARWSSPKAGLTN